MDTKICNRCGQEKDVSKYRHHRAICKTCLNRDKTRARNVKGSKSWYTMKFHRFKSQAHARGIPVNISKDYYTALRAQATCEYCGKEPVTKTIDRVDNRQGYEEGNCVMACRKCNRIKSSLTPESIPVLRKILAKLEALPLVVESPITPVMIKNRYWRECQAKKPQYDCDNDKGTNSAPIPFHIK